MLRKLEFLNLSDNPLSGSLPPELCRLFNSIDTGLDGISVFLLLRQTNLGGPLPECIGSMQGLQVLSIAHSSFSGSIPAGLGAMHSLLKFVAEDNALEGVMPIGLCNSSSLTEIDVAFNKITVSALSRPTPAPPTTFPRMHVALPQSSWRVCPMIP